MSIGRAGTVAALGTAQTLAWASTYYLPAILAAPMARDLGVSTPTVFAAFSAALIVSALLGPRAGAAIDRLGGRPVLIGTSLVFAAGLTALGLAQGPVSLIAAWVVLGIGMGSGLYEAAFAALVRLLGSQSRASITGITLIAGFASTVGWPLSAFLESQVGWRGACFAWAALHLVVGLPLNALLPRASAVVTEKALDPLPAAPDEKTASMRATLALSFVFAATWFT
ncbi:MAG TPA: MFS transporter, partial [Rubrivivax sp.]|nr:MFS transporter [Rubrivivax sp.]